MTKLDRWLLGVIIGIGALLPWATGAGVKLYLQAIGRPTLPWSYFLAPESLLSELPLTAWLATPYLALALLARSVLRGDHVPFTGGLGQRERRALVLTSLLAGAACTVGTFIVIFWEFDPLYFFTPFPITGPALGLGIGWALGLAAVRAVAWSRERNERRRGPTF